MNKFLAMILRALVFALLVGSSLVVASPTYASTINVGCNVTELVNAINTANVNAGADTIELSANCTFTLTTVNNTDVTLGPNGLPVIASDITIHGNNATITRDASAPAFRFLQVNSGAILVLDSMTLGGAQAGQGPNSESKGGGIYNAGTLTLDSCTVTENKAGDVLDDPGTAGDGGGIYNTGTMTLVHSIVSHNAAGSDAYLGTYAGSGGGIYNTGTLTLDDSTLESNTSGQWMYAGGNGGALVNVNGAVNIQDSTIANNSSPTTGMDGGSCGGIVSSGGTLDISGSTFSGNAAQSGGGAICTDSLLSVHDSYLVSNSGTEGGAINATSGTITNSTFSANTANIIPTHCHCIGGFGGAVKGDLLIRNSTFVGNVAAKSGGAIYGSEGLNVVNSTIVSNTANHFGVGDSPPDGGISGGVIANSIIANNINGNCANSTDGGGNMRWPKTDTSCVGKFGAPKLGPLQDNGGATQTMALAPDSAAINAAVDANCPTTDQRGIVRPQGKHCDSGAFELEPPTAVTLVAPRDNKKLDQPQVNLKWSPAQRIAWYRVVVHQNAANGPKIVNVKIKTTVFKTPALESGYWYYWRVKACSKVGCTNSTAWRFRVK